MIITNEIDPEVMKSRAGRFVLEFNHVLPNTVYTPYLGGVDVSASVKPFGKRLGGEIKSDDTGYVKLELFIEIPYEGSYAHDDLETTKPSQNNYGLTDQPSTKTPNKKTQWLFELVSPNSTVFRLLPIRLYVIDGHPNRSSHHGH